MSVTLKTLSFPVTASPDQDVKLVINMEPTLYEIWELYHLQKQKPVFASVVNDCTLCSQNGQRLDLPASTTTVLPISLLYL